jgi:hypothetical protein
MNDIDDDLLNDYYGKLEYLIDSDPRKDPFMIYLESLSTRQGAVLLNDNEPEKIVLKEYDPEKKKKIIDYLTEYSESHTLEHPSVDKADHETIFKNWVTKYQAEQDAKEEKIRQEKQNSESRKIKAKAIRKILSASKEVGNLVEFIASDPSDEVSVEIVRNMKDLELNSVLSSLLADLEQQIKAEDKIENEFNINLLKKMNLINVDQTLVEKYRSTLRPCELKEKESADIHSEECECTYCQNWDWDLPMTDPDRKESQKVVVETVVQAEIAETKVEDKVEKCSASYEGSSIDISLPSGKKTIMFVYVRIPDEIGDEEDYVDSIKENFKKLESSLSANCEIVYIPRYVEGKTEVQVVYI